MPTPIEITIHENALTSDTLAKAPEGYHFKGHNGSIYHLTYYTYANEWGDRANHIYGKTLDGVLKKYDRATHRLADIQDDGDGIDIPLTTDDLAREIDFIAS